MKIFKLSIKLYTEDVRLNRWSRIRPKVEYPIAFIINFGDYPIAQEGDSNNLTSIFMSVTNIN